MANTDLHTAKAVNEAMGSVQLWLRSAMGQKQTFGDTLSNVRFRGLSGHRKGADAESQSECPLLGVKRTFTSCPLYVRL
jgi:hypothetical protein